MELYKIRHLNKLYYFTSHKEDITVEGITYKAIPISRQEITRSLEDNGLKITAPLKDEPFGQLFLQAVSVLSTVEIIRYPENIVLYKGSILKSTFNYEKETVTLLVSQNIILKNTEFPVRSYSSTCGYNFGDRYCGIDKENYSFIVNSSNFTFNEIDNSIQSSVFATKKYLKGGFLIADNRYYSYIMEHNNNKITLLSTFPNPQAILKIKIIPTCDKSPQACQYYNNLDHFGGFPYIPDNNIVTGGF